MHGYFRAIQQKNETSKRALQLTADVIQHNSANYTAWYYRRRCLKEQFITEPSKLAMFATSLLQDLAIELDDERIFTDKWARDCPKNYQALPNEFF